MVSDVWESLLGIEETPLLSTSCDMLRVYVRVGCPTPTPLFHNALQSVAVSWNSHFEVYIQSVRAHTPSPIVM